MALIGKEVPNFLEKIVHNGKIIDNFSLKEWRGSYVFILFYPMDFTFVCPTELIAFQNILLDLEKKNCKLIACSTDSPYCHLAWLKTPKKNGGIQGVTYPIFSDLTKHISRLFGVINEDLGVAYRGLFLIDKTGIIRHAIINDLPLGRNTDEALRILEALIAFDQHGNVCPANWKMGNKSLKPTEESLKAYLSEEEKDCYRQ